MFSFFKKPVTEKSTSCSEDKVQVFIWTGNPKNVGHVSIQLDSKEPKRQENQEGNYLSIWPRNIPAIGPVVILPLRATFAKTLTEDTIAESFRPDDITDMNGLKPIINTDHSSPVEPDRVYTICGLDKEKAEAEAKRLENGLESGRTRYQLFPNVKTTEALKSMTLFSAQNPFSGTVEQNPKMSVDLPEQYNCATIAQHLLKTAGMSSLPVTSTWSPAKLAKILDNQPNTTRNINFSR